MSIRKVRNGHPRAATIPACVLLTTAALVALWVVGARSAGAVGATRPPRDAAVAVDASAVRPEELLRRPCSGPSECGGYLCLCILDRTHRAAERAVAHCSPYELHGGMNCVIERGRVRMIRMFTPNSAE